MESGRARKPSEVAGAVNLLWAALALGPIKVLLDWRYLRAHANPAFMALVMGAVIAVSVALILQIARGRNWARVTYLVLTILGSVPYLTSLKAELERSLVLGGMSVAQMGLQIVALWLLFTSPGKASFARRHA